MKLQETIKKSMLRKENRKYLILFLFCGIVLMLIPVPNGEETVMTEKNEMSFSVQKEELRLEEIVSAIKGVHTCKVLLSVTTGTETILAENEGKPIVVSNGSREETITILERYPRYQGAVIVIGGYSDAGVRFDVLSAVMSYTGLDHDKITICPIEE